MAVTIYYDNDADLAALKDKKVAVIGYGSQGHAHAQNLRESGVDVVVGLAPGSKSRALAEEAGLRVADVADAVREADVIMIAVPDTVQKSVYDAVGDKLQGLISRASFSLDLAAKRPSVGIVNEMYRKRAERDLNDNTSRQFTAMLVLADALNRAGSTDGAKLRAALETSATLRRKSGAGAGHEESTEGRTP